MFANTLVVLTLLSLLSYVFVYEMVDPNDRNAVQYAQLLTLRDLTDIQKNISLKQLEVLENIKPNQNDWFVYAMALPVYFILLFFIKQVLSVVWYLIKLKSDRVGEVMRACANAQNLWRNRAQFHTLDEYRSSLKPPVMYTICTCCKRVRGTGEEYALP